MSLRLLSACTLLFVATLSKPSLGQQTNYPHTDDNFISERIALDKRLTELTKKIESNPTNVAMLLARAKIYIELDRRDEVIADLDRAVAIDPKSGDNLLAAGEVIWNLDPWVAVKYFNRAIKLSKTNAAALVHRAIAYDKAGERVRAMKDIEAALLLRPDDPLIIGMKGNMFMNEGKLNEAIEYFSKSISIRPTPEVLFDRAFCFQKVGKMEESIADYTAAYQLDNKRIDAICERGQVYQQGGNFELAIRDFEQCYKVKPDAPQAALQLAWILATCPDESLRDGARALTIAGDNCDLITCRRTEPLNALAAAYAELGDFQKAKQLQQRAVALSHFSPEFHETSTRRLNTITNHSPIREANIPLAVLPHFTSELTREITLEEVMSAPPDVVGLSYLEVSTILDFCPLSKLGATVNATLDGVYLQLTPFNTNRIEKLLKNRLTVYEEAMRKRGSSQLKAGYQPQLNGGCSEWGISDEPILVEQEGFKIHLTQGNVRHKGVVIESTVVIRHDANVGVLISGEIVGDNLVFVTPIYDSAGGDAAVRCTATLVPHEIAGPSWSKAYVGRANAHFIFGNYPSLIADLERSVEMDANSQTWSYLAYRLATCPDKKVRDGKRALTAALTAQTLAQDKSELEVLVALAAAYAENRDFESAIKYQKQVIEKAGVDEKIFYEERLKLFEAKRPLRDKFGSAF